MDKCPFSHGTEGAPSAGAMPNYGEVLNITKLLSCVQPFAKENPAHDELLFGVVHQVSELWFRLLLHELDTIGSSLRSGGLRQAARLLKRCTEIIRLTDGGFTLLESMRATDYAKFRPSLMGGSGFQSAQFREVEVALGCHRESTLNQAAFTEEERARIARRLQEPTLWDSFVTAMRSCGYEMPTRREAAEDPAVAEKALRLLADMYGAGAHPDLQDVSEEMTGLDNAILLWRTHHAAMAERAIGGKPGTANTGPSGVGYLYGVAHRRCFPELMAMRNYL